jgi:hypothetical protein
LNYKKETGPKEPSKWLKTIAIQNYKYFAERLAQLEVKKRVQAIKKMRFEFRRRVNLLQSLYRQKKFGEPLMA